VKRCFYLLVPSLQGSREIDKALRAATVPIVVVGKGYNVLIEGRHLVNRPRVHWTVKGASACASSGQFNLSASVIEARLASAQIENNNAHLLRRIGHRDAVALCAERQQDQIIGFLVGELSCT
jgi:hypothetical protein